MTRYEQLAQQVRDYIGQGLYRVGDKLPSVRDLGRQHAVSISTVQEAYRLLEDEGLIIARPKSGYFVAPALAPVQQLPDISRPPPRPLEVSQWFDVLNLLLSRDSEGVIGMGHAMPDYQVPTIKPLLKELVDMSRHRQLEAFSYGDIRGCQVLREQLARVSIASGCQLHPDDLVVTSGCQEALAVCLRTVASEGDIIAIDSPSFYGSMQAIKASNLKAMEIPTHPETGMSLEALELALEQWPIKAIQVTPTCNNPLGYTMPEENKKKLYQLARSYDLPIIEDDIYGDIAYAYPRPKSIKSMDDDGRVLLCSSFSKTIAPGLRVGWIAAGRYCGEVTHTKYISSSMCPVIPQLAVSEFIARGHYERHLRRVRRQYQRARDAMLVLLQQHLPRDTRISFPLGGFVLWVELGADIDSVALANIAKNNGVSIAPGVVFSATGKYRNCIRLNYGISDQELLASGVKRLAQSLEQLLIDR